MKIVCLFILAALFIISSCTHKEVAYYDNDNAIPISSEGVDSIIIKEKPIRLTYVDNEGVLQKNLRGYLTKSLDAAYQFERRKLGAPPSNERINIGLGQIRKIVVVENDAPQARDFFVMGAIAGLALLVIVLTFTMSVDPILMN